MYRTLIMFALVAGISGFAQAVEAVEYFVGKDGLDTNTCVQAQSSSTPKLTISGASGIFKDNCVSGGDKVTIKDGTYDETISSNDIPNGTGFPIGATTIQSQNALGAVIQPADCGTLVTIIHLDTDTHNLIFDGLMLDGNNVTSCKLAVRIDDRTTDGQSIDNIRFSNNEMKDTDGSEGGVGQIGTFLQNSTDDNYTGFEILRNNLHDHATGRTFTGNHCMYIKLKNSLIERNVIDTCRGSGISTHGDPGDTNTYRYNLIKNTVNACIRLSSGPNNISHHNVCAPAISTNSTTSNLPLQISLESPNNNKHWNNTVFDGRNSNGFAQIRVTDNEIVNNIGFGGVNDIIQDIGPSLGTITNNLCDSGVGCDVTTDPLVVNSAGGDFALTAASPAIDAGTDVGLAFNGDFPDIGAFETFVSSGAEVGGVDATSLLITFAMAVNTPILPATGCTGFTVRQSALPITVSSCVRQGTNQMDLTLATGISAGTAVDFSYSTASGNVSDSALIGDSLNQRLNGITNQSVANSVTDAGGPVSSMFAQFVAFIVSIFEFLTLTLFTHNAFHRAHRIHLIRKQAAREYRPSVQQLLVEDFRSDGARVVNWTKHQYEKVKVYRKAA